MGQSAITVLARIDIPFAVRNNGEDLLDFFCDAPSQIAPPMINFLEGLGYKRLTDIFSINQFSYFVRQPERLD